MVTKRDPSQNPISRYKFVDEINEAGRPYLDLPNHPPIEKTPLDILHIVRAAEENRLDIVAFRFYRDVGFWWIIAHANNILDPTVVKVGSVLRIPPLNSIYGQGGIL